MDGAAASSTQENGTHLWIPEPESRSSASDPAPSSSRAPRLLKERLYVGNLSSTVDEYALLQVFTRFGKIAKLDFLFHKSGVNKGKPRGYAFVEFMNEADAGKALQAANGKLLRGRRLVVTFAQQAPNYDSGSGPYGGRHRRSDVMPTALSLTKSSGITRPEAKTSTKIAMMEAKLRQMANSSGFAERPVLPNKPAGPREDARGTGSVSGEGQGMMGDGRLLVAAAMRDVEPSDVLKAPSSGKQRSLRGVKILKGGPHGGKSIVTPST